MVKAARKLVRDERGATAVEYAFIVALIAMASIVAWAALGNQLDDTYSAMASKLNAINTAAGGE